MKRVKELIKIDKLEIAAGPLLSSYEKCLRQYEDSIDWIVRLEECISELKDRDWKLSNK